MAPVQAIASLLSAAALVPIIERTWGLEHVRCRIAAVGSNDHFLVEAAGEWLMLRLYGIARGGPAEVAYELQLSLAAARDGVAIVQPRPTADGALCTVVEAPEGPRVAALFTFADGPLATADDAAAVGAEAARLHLAGDTFDFAGHRRALDVRYLVDDRIDAISVLLDARPDVAAWAHGFAVDVSERLTAALADDGLDVGPCHGDLHLANATVLDGRACLFDLEFAGPGWRAYDLATYRWALDFRPADPEPAWQAFLDGYRQVRPISQRDLDLVPLFVAARCVWLLGHWARSEGPEPGAVWFPPVQLDWTLDIARAFDPRV